MTDPIPSPDPDIIAFMAKFDQDAALLGDTLPSLLHRFYQGLKHNDFTEEQALAFTNTFLEQWCMSFFLGDDDDDNGDAWKKGALGPSDGVGVA